MVGAGDIIMRSDAIGSCVVVVAYVLKKKIGSLAHVMLPGRSPEKCHTEKTKYAADAIEVMLEKLNNLAVDIADIEVCLVGGANVLKRSDDTIWKENIDSVIGLLKEKDIKIKNEALGGNESKSISLDIEKGIVSYREGTGERKAWDMTGNAMNNLSR